MEPPVQAARRWYRSAPRASPRKRLFGFRNRSIAASSVKKKRRIPYWAATEVEMYRADPTGNHLGLPWGKGLYWEHLRPLLGRLKRALRMEQRLTVEEFNQLLQLSDAIIDYGRMIQEYNEFPVPNVIVEIPELAHRFRETPQTIQDALRLLRDIGRAEPAELSGCWILNLAHLSARDDLPTA